MLKNITKLSSSLRYAFSTNAATFPQLQTIISKQLQKISKPQTIQTDHLQMKGWKINLNSEHIHMEKTLHDYFINITNSPKAHFQNGQDSDNFKEIKIKLKKQGCEKDLHILCLIFNQRIHFDVMNLQSSTKTEQQLKYGGPDLNNLEKSLQDSIAAFLQEIGLDETTLYEVREICESHEQQLYGEWLRKFQELL